MSSQASLCTAIGFVVPLLAGLGYAQDSLPPVRQLIVETLTLCDADREENSESLDTLAEAQAYLGDFSAARKTLLSISTDWRLAHLNCAKIEIELTGSVASIPDAYWKSDQGIMRCKAALAFIQRGEIDKSIEQINQVPSSAHSSLNVFGFELIQKLQEQNATEACRKVALAWASRLNQAEEITSYRQHYRVPQLVAWLVELNERPAAAALCDHWHSVLKSESNVNQWGALLGKAWAEYAQALAAIDKEAASSALDQACYWIEKWRSFEMNTMRRGSYSNLAEAYAAIGARQALMFDRDKANAAYQRAYDAANVSLDSRDSRFGDFAYELIVAEQLKADDEQGARETIKRTPTLRTAARCWIRISSYALARGDNGLARAASRAACQILDNDGFESFVAEDMALAASNAGRAGERETARKLFQRAIALSNADKSPKSMHPFIASFQVEGGLFTDAYATIQSISRPSDRPKPLADLCLAFAKAEKLERKRRP